MLGRWWPQLGGRCGTPQGRRRAPLVGSPCSRPRNAFPVQAHSSHTTCARVCIQLFCTTVACYFFSPFTPKMHRDILMSRKRKHVRGITYSPSHFAVLPYVTHCLSYKILYFWQSAGEGWSGGAGGRGVHNLHQQ